MRTRAPRRKLFERPTYALHHVMNPNPYEPPRSYEAPGIAVGYPQGYPASAVTAPGSRTLFILAAVGAWFASVYWAVFTGLAAVGASMGSGSFISVILPCYLIVMYAVRGFQIIKGDPAAAQRIISLHVIGAVFAVVNVVTGASAILMVLQSFKVLIHIFGGTTAYLARRSFERSVLAQR